MHLRTALLAFWKRRLLLLGGVCLAALLALQGDALKLIRPTPSTDRMAAELLRASERGDICTSANAVGVGLQGEYFSEPNLQGSAKMVRVDDVVDFDDSIRQTFGHASDQPVRSVRWRGWIKAPLSGRYRFHADAPDMQVLVARNLVAGADVAPDESVQLAAGRFYPVEVVVNRVTESGPRIRLEWTAPHGARFVIPKALLHLPTATVAAPKS